MASGEGRSREFLLVFPVAGVLCLVGAFGWAILRTQLEPGSIALGLLGIALFLTVFFRAEAPNLRAYAAVGLYGLFTLGSLALIYLLAKPHDRQYDLTAQGLHTLSDATRKYLQLLKKDVEIVVFDVTPKPYAELLNDYARATPRIKWSVHDPRVDPLFTKKFDESVVDGTLYVVHGEKKKLLAESELGENTLTNAIVEVTRDRKIKIYFLTGHGELEYEIPKQDAPARSKQRSLGLFRDLLGKRAVETAPLDLSERGFIPEDASLLVIAGPTQDLFDAEARWLEKYLNEGGRLLLLFDAPVPDFAKPFPNLTAILRRRGVEDSRGVIVDLRGKKLYDDPLQATFAEYNGTHPITKSLARSSQPLAIPLTRGLRPAEPASEEFLVRPLAVSSPESWIQPLEDLAGRSEIVANPPGQGMKAEPLGVAVQQMKKEGEAMRLVAFGSSQLINNRLAGSHETALELMLASVNWLTEQEDLIDVPQKTVTGTPIMLTNAQKQLILIALVMAFPSALFFGGIIYTQLLRRA